MEGVWRWRCVSLPAELEGVVWSGRWRWRHAASARPWCLDRPNRRSPKMLYKSALGDVRGSQSRGENPRTSFKINNLKPNFFSITTPHRHTLTVPSRLPASRIPAACGTVLQMALVIAARYSELPPESAAPPCVRGARGRIQPIRSSLPSGAQPVADQLCSGLWAHKAPFLSCNWCLARVDVVFLLKFDVLTYHN